MSLAFNNQHQSNQLPTFIGPRPMTDSLSVTLASDQPAIPVTGTFTATSPAVGTTGATAPTSAELVGFKDPSGNLQPGNLTAGGAVKTDSSATTQPVSGSVSVTNFPATQPVSGTVAVSNFPATQNVAVTSSVLPTGAATSAKQPALGTAGTASTDVITVQGIAGAVALKVDGSAATQPVSGTVAATQSGAWNITNITGSVTLPTGAATSALQTTGNTSLATLATNSPALVSGRVPVDGSGVTQPVSGAVTVSGTATTTGAASNAVFQPEGSIAGASLTTTYTTIVTTSAAWKQFSIRNTTDTTVSVSMDGGATTTYVFDSGDAIIVDLRADNLQVASGVVIQAKATPGTKGAIRVNGLS